MTRAVSHRARTVVCLLVLAVVATACSLWQDATVEPTTVTAVFPRTANLFTGSEVRVLGLQVGEVADIEPVGDRVEVTLRLDGERDYPADAVARLQPVSLLGERFVQLDPPYTGGATLEDGAVIPAERTAIPADVDEVLRSFEEFLASLDAGALADLIDVLADTLDGNGQGLNDLVAGGSQTIRVLADSSVDLNAVVDELGALNETLATREERIGSTLTNASVVLRNLQQDRDLLVGALTELTRATAELEPLVSEQTDPLVRDLEILATTLATVERNLDRLGTAFFGSQRLFNTAGRIIDYENARLPLDDEVGALVPFIQDRVVDRIVGLCLRLDLLDCDSIEEVLQLIPDLCLPGLCSSDEATTSYAEAIGVVVSQLSPESQQAIAEEIQRQPAAAADPEPAPAEPAAPDAPQPPDADRGSDEAPARPALPAPDPRLEGRGSLPVPQVPDALRGGS